MHWCTAGTLCLWMGPWFPGAPCLFVQGLQLEPRPRTCNSESLGVFGIFACFGKKNTIGPNRTLMFPIDSACHVFAAKESSSVLGVWFQVLMNYDMLCFSPWASCCPALVLSNWFWPIIRLKSFSNTAALNNSNDFNAGLHREDWIAADFLTKTRKHKEQVPSIHCGTLGFDWIRLHLN